MVREEEPGAAFEKIVMMRTVLVSSIEPVVIVFHTTSIFLIRNTERIPEFLKLLLSLLIFALGLQQVSLINRS